MSEGLVLDERQKPPCVEAEKEHGSDELVLDERRVASGAARKEHVLNERRVACVEAEKKHGTEELVLDEGAAAG